MGAGCYLVTLKNRDGPLVIMGKEHVELFWIFIEEPSL